MRLRLRARRFEAGRSNGTDKRRLLVAACAMRCLIYGHLYGSGSCVHMPVWGHVRQSLEYVHSSYVYAPCSVHMRVCLGRILACASTSLWFHTILSS